MKLQGVLAVAGKPGLHKLAAQGRGGIVVESLVDGRKFPIPSTAQVSALQDISMYTYSEEKPLREVFAAMFTHLDGNEAPSHKSSAQELQDFLRAVLPEYDEDRVYTSDIKKLVQWYNLLLKFELVNGNPEEEEEENQEKPAE